eukprot:Blabericola_migrator_1__964@NODE_1240_length_5014_cov_104_765110_g839_i0_p5_GENE_NODE_1240_length_5014_cov_104_765110_g839_i0NODE_1240_length_5014_cov_104_765110_g839_i0_p5_ORF_typecomplete_len132_score9_64_NODE_1240_length_5014_cov_104_765110_g839_i09211316
MGPKLATLTCLGSLLTSAYECPAAGLWNGLIGERPITMELRMTVPGVPLMSMRTKDTTTGEYVTVCSWYLDRCSSTESNQLMRVVSHDCSQLLDIPSMTSVELSLVETIILNEPVLTLLTPHQHHMLIRFD